MVKIKSWSNNDKILPAPGTEKIIGYTYTGKAIYRYHYYHEDKNSKNTYRFDIIPDNGSSYLINAFGTFIRASNNTVNTHTETLGSAYHNTNATTITTNGCWRTESTGNIHAEWRVMGETGLYCYADIYVDYLK